MSTKIWNPVTGKWETHGVTNAVQIPILDVAGHFEGDEEGNKTVERALAELAENAGTASEEDIRLLQNRMRNAEGRITQNEEDIAWLKENGGSSVSTPTISSDQDSEFTVEEGTNIRIPIFFTSPNLGEGTAYVIIDGIESAYQTVNQGNNTIEVGVLESITSTVQIYVRDRANLMSNQLTFRIVSGGIRMSINFDSTADYMMGSDIIMPYTITTESIEDIIVHITVDYDVFEQEARNGYNEYVFQNLSVGVHRVYVYASSGAFRTPTTRFNIVVVNSSSLYISTTFEENQTLDYGTPININYRISKMGSETFRVYLYLDGTLTRQLNQTSGSYFWTLNDVEVGEHIFEIRAESDYGETASLTGSFNVEYGDYTPVRVTQAGMTCWINASEKTNQDVDREEFLDMSGRGVSCHLRNCNYSTNGWVDGRLLLDGGAFLEIDHYPWQTNALNGSTIEIWYKCNNIGVDDSVVLDYTDATAPYKGCSINLREIKLQSMANSRSVYVDEDVWTTVSFVIDRSLNSKFGKCYINGVNCGAINLSDSGVGTTATYEDFSHNSKIYLGRDKNGNGEGSIEVGQVRVYQRALSDDEIVQNYLSQITDLEVQRRAYNFCFNNTTTPVMRLYGDTTDMSPIYSKQMRVRYISPNTELYGQSFDLPYCDVWWQGTSSIQYVLKNYSIRLRDENMAEYFYTPFRNTREESIFTIKADYMESSHARNVGLAKLINDCVYDTKNPSQVVDDKVRNCVCGFPIIVYINDELQGVYNFNFDRYSTRAFGYDLAGGAISYEISANTDTTAGAFYPWTADSGRTERDYYASDFEAIYPETRRAGDDDYEEIRRLVNWVGTADDILFREQISEYFNLEYLLRYYLCVLVFGAVDNLGKNAKITTWDGRIWYFQFYDLDTTVGLDNSGFLRYDSDIEIESGVFNTSNSLLWTKVQRVFSEELKAQYSLMRQRQFTLDNIMSYVYGEQISQIPETYYNNDMRVKYLNFGSQYLYACHGNAYQHIKRWLRERIVYCDTLFDYTASTSDYITVRANHQGQVYLDLQTYVPMYLKVKWRDEAGDTGTHVKKVGRGETVRFEYTMPTATDQEKQLISLCK